MKTDSYIYILTNEYNKVFYIGVTTDLIKRIWEHKNKIADGFTKKYNLQKLVYYEAAGTIESAIIREKQLKNWHRKWKIDLVKTFNPTFEDLYSKII